MNFFVTIYYIIIYNILYILYYIYYIITKNFILLTRDFSYIIYIYYNISFILYKIYYNEKVLILTRDLSRNYMCSLMMIRDMLSKHVGAVKSVLKKWFKINDIQLVHLLLVWYLVNLQDARCNNKDNYFPDIF